MERFDEVSMILGGC